MHSTKFTYTTFSKENWNYNVDRFFFLFFLGVVYNLIIFYIIDFKISSGYLMLRFLTGWIEVLVIISIIEGIFATIAKIGLTPSCLIDTKFIVLKVLPKTVYHVIKSYFSEFKQVNFQHTIYVPDPYIFTGIAVGLNSCYNGELIITGYIKEPDTFK